MSDNHTLLIKNLGITDYQTTWSAMQQFNQQRSKFTPDEIWLLQHLPVYTQGLAGKDEHLIKATSIPVIRTDRGGQITYHGPGQLIIYLMLDLKRNQLTVKQLVSKLEASVISYLSTLNCAATADPDARGVYVNQRKIASIGLRVAKNCSYHGLALNVAMDLKPFANINPCGIKDLAITQIKDISHINNIDQVIESFTTHLTQQLNYARIKLITK